MKTTNRAKETRDEVLTAFHEACERPTAEQIIEWTTRYPQFADDIRAHAAIARDWEARKDYRAEAPDESLLSRGQSRILNAIYNAQVASTAEKTPESCESFQQMMASRGTDVPKLARELNIARSVLADLVNGGMLAPVGERLVDAFTVYFAIPVDKFDQALRRALSAPHFSHAKAESTPVVIPRAYEEVISTSEMQPEQIKYWLGEK